MPVIDLLLQGVGLMLAGMSIVFGFLLVLVGTLCVASKTLQKIFPDDYAKDNDKKPCIADQKLIAVISAALGRYRADN